jgi:hypothetical protein
MSTLVRAPKIGWLAGALAFGAASIIIRRLSGNDPVAASLMAAPEDTEPFTPEQRAKVKAAAERMKAGQGIPFEEAFPENEPTP